MIYKFVEGESVERENEGISFPLHRKLLVFEILNNISFNV